MGRLNSIWCLVCLGVLTCFQPAYSQGAPAAPQPGAVPALVAPVAPARGGIPTISNIPIPGARAVGAAVLPAATSLVFSAFPNRYRSACFSESTSGIGGQVLGILGVGGVTVTVIPLFVGRRCRPAWFSRSKYACQDVP